MMQQKLIKKRKESRASLDDEYKDLNRQTRASRPNDKKAWYSKIVDDLELASKINNMSEVHQTKNILLGKSSKRATHIRDFSGNVSKDKASCLQRWAEYFEGLLNAEEPEELIDFSSYTPTDKIDTSQNPPSRDKLDKTNSLFKRNKAPAIDNISPELLNDGGNNIREWLLRICRLIWHKESTPGEWGKASYYHCQRNVPSSTVITTEELPY